MEYGLAGGVGGAYWRTLGASVAGGDSGELLAEACQAGVAHPPVYPSFVLYMRAAMALAAGVGSSASPARVANAANAAAGVAAALAVYGTVLNVIRLGRLRTSGGGDGALPASAVVVAGGVAAAMALSPLFWLYAIGAEVFALNNAAVGALCWVFTRYALVLTRPPAAGKTEPDGVTAAGALVAGAAGLALTNQHTAVLYALPLAAWVAASQAATLTVRRAGVWVAVGLAGLLPYAWLPAAHTWWRGPGSWGDTSTLAGFLRHFLRQDYGTFQLMTRAHGAVEGPVARHVAFATDLATVQLPHPAWAAAAAVGVIVAVWRAASASGGSAKGWAARWAQSAPLALVVALAVYLAVFHGLANMPLTDPLLFGVHQRFWMQPALLVFTLCGVGADAAVVAAGRVAEARRVPLLVAALAVAVAGVAVGGPVAQYRSHAGALDHSGNDVMARYGAALLTPLPPGAILVTGYDMQWTAARYLQTCEGVRRDVALFNAPVMSFTWFAAQRHLYPGVAFPGTHLTTQFTAPHAAGAFSMADFFAANLAPDGGARLLAAYNTAPPHPDYVRPRNVANIPPVRSGSGGGVFYTGGYVGDDTSADLAFDMLPFGIVLRVVPKAEGGESRMTWVNYTAPLHVPARDAPGPPRRLRPADANAAAAAWAAVTAAYDGLPNTTAYDERTWEFATRVDYWNAATAYAAWLLEWALARDGGGALRSATTGPDGPIHLPSVLAAARLLEGALAARTTHAPTTIPPNLHKNLGLAYMRLVRCPARLPPPTTTAPWPVPPGLPPPTAAAIASGDEAALRAAASTRVLDTWRIFLAAPDAAADASTPAIANVVSVLESALARSAAAATASGSTA